MPRASFRAWLLAAVCCAATCACSGGGAAAGADAGTDSDDTETGADLDTDSDSDGDSDTGPPIPAECPTALVPPCEDELYELPLLLSAESIADGLRFVDATDYVIAGERELLGDVDIITVRRRDAYYPWWSDDNQVVASLVLDSGRLVGAAAAGSDDDDPSSKTALLVCQDSGACAVYLEFRFWDEGRMRSDSAIEPLPRWTLPESLAARRIRPASEATAVVVGNGAVALMWDGSVVELVPSGGGAPLNDAWDTEVFVGEGGRVVRRDQESGAFEEVDAGTDADLVAVADLSEFAAADGTLGVCDPEACAIWSWTPLAAEPLVEVHAGYQHLALTASGCAIELSEEAACVTGVVPEPAARAITWRCADSTNTDVLAPGGLYGYAECYDIW